MNSLSRREFLAITAVMLEAACSGWPMAALAETRSPVPAAPLDLSMLSEKIGQHYLSLFPAESDLPHLEDTLHFAPNSQAQEIKLQLRQDIHSDFALEQTFRYAGWVFSHTEGRLCAFKALSSGLR